MSARTLPQPSVEPGTMIKTWRVVRCLGTGSMGEVYEAKSAAGKRVAVKIMREGVDAQLNAALRLLEEARAASAIHHPNIVEVIDVGLFRERPYLVMELLEGTPLSIRLKHGPFTLVDAIDVLEGILDATDAAHRAGVVHRDLKPSNVFLLGAPGAYRVKLLDFGIARREGRKELLTAPAMAVGSMGYMAPEQLLGSAVPASDLYAVGCLAFLLFTGRPVFPLKNIPENARLHLVQPPPKLRSLRAECSAALEAFVDQLLAKRPEDRPAPASVALARLRTVTGRVTGPQDTRTELVPAFVPRANAGPTVKDPPSERTTATAKHEPGGPGGTLVDS